MGTKDYTEIVDELLGGGPPRDTGWRKFGILRNPFPSRAHPIWEVLYNQEAVVRRFWQDLSEFIRESNTLTLFFTGGNRVGKTHFMEYNRIKIPQLLGTRGIVLPVAVTSAQSCDIWPLYERVLDHLDDSLRRQTGSGLFEHDLDSAAIAELNSLPAGDFRCAALSRATASGPKEREEKVFLLRDWLRGGRLRAPQRKILGVTGNIASTAQLINAFEGLIKYLLIAGKASFSTAGESIKVPGLLVFIDEFELIYTSRRDRRDLFLQGLRAVIDACPKGLFLCVAMATGVGVDHHQVEANYPALFARLKGSRDIPSLVQVGGVLDAIEYAKAFMDFAREEARAKNIGPGEELLSQKEIERLFKEIAPNSSVSQGEFFDRLHNEAEQRARGAERS